jgi:hypothetical protein
MSQQTRVVHVKDEHDVYIGRSMPGRAGSEFANPFKIGEHGNRAEVINRYREHITARLDANLELRAALTRLKGKRLGCWCRPAACHGDVLVELLEGLPVADQAPPQLDLF